LGETLQLYATIVLSITEYRGHLKMQDWKMMDKIAGLENARLENDGQKCSR